MTTADSLKSLADMKIEESGTIVEIHGGEGVSTRLAAIGVIPGKKIMKTSSFSVRGPVTIKIDRAQLALGYGMADKIMVRTDGSAP